MTAKVQERKMQGQGLKARGRKRKAVATIALDETELRALDGSILRSLKVLRGGEDWAGERPALLRVGAKIRDIKLGREKANAKS